MLWVLNRGLSRIYFQDSPFFHLEALMEFNRGPPEVGYTISFFAVPPDGGTKGPRVFYR